MPRSARCSERSIGASLVAAAPKGYIGWLEKQIVFAGRPVGWTVRRIVAWKIVLPSSASSSALLFCRTADLQPLRMVLARMRHLMLFFLPDVLINSRAHDRQEAIKLALPDTLDQMTIAVEAGLGFDAAMAKAARGGKGPLAEELVRVLQDMSIGRTRRDVVHRARATHEVRGPPALRPRDRPGRRLRHRDR